MEKPWIKIIGMGEDSGQHGKCLVRCKKPWLAAARIIWATDSNLETILLINGYDYGICKPPIRRKIWTEEVAIICMHIQDCLNIHEAFYRKILDLDEEKV